MAKIDTNLNFVLALSKAQATINRRLDGQLGAHGLSFSDFVTLHHLAHANGEKLRRIDLAEKLGVTASGITRMLAPMEKTGLVSREATGHDARISYVVLAPGGRRVYEESLKTASYIAGELLPLSKAGQIEKLTETLHQINGNL